MKTRTTHYRAHLLACITVGALLSPPIVMASEWGYQGEHGVDNWGAISATCSDGKNQSPIDINSDVTHRRLARQSSNELFRTSF